MDREIEEALAIRKKAPDREVLTKRKEMAMTASEPLCAPEYPPVDPRVEALVNEVIGRVADKWTMIVLDVLAENGELRFTRIAALSGGVSQKMLTQTLRQMERDGLVVRTVHPVIPPKVEYRLTDLASAWPRPSAACGNGPKRTWTASRPPGRRSTRRARPPAEYENGRLRRRKRPPARKRLEAQER